MFLPWQRRKNYNILLLSLSCWGLMNSFPFSSAIFFPHFYYCGSVAADVWDSRFRDAEIFCQLPATFSLAEAIQNFFFSFLTSIQSIYACPWWKLAFWVTQCHIKCQHSTAKNLKCNTAIIGTHTTLQTQPNPPGTVHGSEQ
jgi:hypothetical protein